MTNTFIVLFCLLPFANFIIQKVDIWHSQGYFLQSSILILYCLHLAEQNKPLGALVFWVGSLTIFNFIKIHVMKGVYPTSIFLPFFNFLCIVILYEFITKYITKKHMEQLARYFSIVIFIIMGYAVLQYFNLDQFYKRIDSWVKTDSVVGIMGNQMHFAHFLAISCPLFFLLKKNWCFVGIVSTLAVIGLTNTSSGLIIAFLLIVFCSVLCKIFTKRETILTIIFIMLSGFHLFPHIGNFFSDSGRFELWQKFVPFFKEKPIIGLGLGMINQIVLVNQIKYGDSLYRYVHNEYFQFAIEIGVIGLVLIFWGIIDYFKKFWYAEKDKVTVCMAAMFIGFLLCSLTGFPAHLFMLAALGILGYSWGYKKNGEKINANSF